MVKRVLLWSFAISLCVFAAMVIGGLIVQATGGSAHTAASSRTGRPQPRHAAPRTTATRTHHRPKPGKAPGHDNAAIAGFTRAFWRAAGEEGAAFREVYAVDLTPTSGGSTLPALRDAETRLQRALGDQARGGPSPFDDIGAATLNALSDEAGAVEDMQSNWGSQRVHADMRTVQRDHAGLLRREDEMRRHGYRQG